MPTPSKFPRALSAHQGPDLEPVDGMEPVYGWSLLSFEEEDGDGFWRKHFAAQRGAKLVVLDVSSFNFQPTQDRFAWLVRNGFPKRPPPKGAWFGEEIDERIGAEREALAA